MKVNDFTLRIAETPRYVAVFEVTNRPTWAIEWGVEKGDLLYWVEGRDSFYHMRRQMLIGLSAPHVKFYDYWTPTRIREYQSVFKKTS